ncbi:MAG TPA: DUF4294 domain-containing protein [Chitinophagaceae bacterium]|nr:DUF4294 domain-containing protein [Chitinophagaceae bacterium]
MRKKVWYSIAFGVFFLLLVQSIYAQSYYQHKTSDKRSFDTLIVSGIVVSGDTLPFRFLNSVPIYGEIDPQRAAELQRLRYNIMKVYPYVLIAADVLQKVDDELITIDKRRDRRRYIKKAEEALSEQFKEELKNLTVTQGQLLVKLINRETGRETYEIIKQLKGGLNARIYQTTAFFFSNNLKNQYDPFGEDADIESIVTEIEQYYKGQRRNVELPKR